MTWLTHAWPQVVDLIGRHLLVAVPALLLSVVLAVPLGYVAARRPRIGGAVLTAASVLYAIPALPLLIVIPVVSGLPLRSTATVIVALTIYGTALLARSAGDAFGTVDRDVRAAAVAIGYSRASLWWRVDLPLATPVIVAGARVVAVSTVGLATIGALIGVPTLGTLFTDGFQRGIVAEVVTGILATVAIALLLDASCLIVGRLSSPWTRLRAMPAVATGGFDG